MQTVSSTSTDQREDAELLTAIAETRDAAAFNELFERHQRAAYNLALHLAGERSAAEEVVQEAMLRVWTSASSYRAEGQVKSWLLKIVAREAIKLMKNKRRKQKEMDRDSKRGTRANDDAQDEAKAELIGALRERLNQLPALERQLLGLHFSGGLTQQEIGEALAIPQQTVSYKITEALKRLRTSLSGAGLAAAIPLVNGSGLSEAICSGHTVPTALQAKVMAAVSGTKTAAASAVRHSIRAKKAATASSKAGIWLATVTVVTVTAGAVYVATKNTTPPPAPAPVVTPAPIAAPVDPRNEPIKVVVPDFHVRWNFADGKKADLYTAMNDWTWNATEKAMAAPKYMKVIFPLGLPANPVKITARAKILEMNKDGTYGYMLMGDGALVQPRTWKREFKGNTAELEYTTYIFDPYMVEFFGEKISRIVEFEKPHAEAVPVLSIQNLYVREIEMRGIKLEDVPAAIREPLKLTDGMKMMRPEDDPGLQKKPPTGE